MVKRGSSQRADRSQAIRYRQVGHALLQSARSLMHLGDLDRYYGNAIAIVCVHAAIAYNDALTIAYGGVKSTEGEHVRAADLLRATLRHSVPPEKARLLELILKRKDAVSYQGVYYSVEEAAHLFGQVEEFCLWAERMYEQRPAAS